MARKVGQTEFGEKLRALRESQGLSQKQLGEQCGIHPNTIAKLERGEQEPAWPLLLIFSKALGVNCTAFGGLVEPDSEPTPTPSPELPVPEKRKRGRPKKRADDGKAK
jgi:transcriptional regulator with XRE-family HTH domain